MSILPLQAARVPDLLQSNSAEQAITSIQQQLLQVQNQISTGKQVSVPSDNPTSAAVIMQLQKTLQNRKAYSQNISTAASQMGEADATLGDLNGLLLQAQQIASANVGSDVTSSQRAAAASLVQSISSQVLSIANKQFNGLYLFGGGSSSQPFVQQNGGVTYVGASQPLKNTVDDGTTLPFQASGTDVFGALGTGVKGSANITPALSAQTRLTDLQGACLNGISLGTIQISNGAVTRTVDLSNASSVGDVINAINNAGVGGITAAITGQGITLTGSLTDNISVTDLGGATSAKDLGIATTTPAGAGNPVIGSSLNPQVTSLTTLTKLRNGAGLDTTGLLITNGSASKTVSFAGAVTVQDLLNDINGAGLGVKAQINAAGTGIDVLNATQGTKLSIAEAGGTTAAQLGLRTLSASTPLSQLNGGKGVGTVTGNDIQINLANGSSFQVNVDGSTTVQDVINAINTAATAAGGGLTASFATTGNGIVLSDTTGGAGKVSVQSLNGSTAAADLGLSGSAVGTVLTGTDANSVASGGIFGHLQQLISALQNNDQAGITAAGSGVAADSSRVILIQGQTGAVEQELQARQTSLSSEDIATQTLLSSLQDTDMTSAITKFTQLQTALQASLQIAGRSTYFSLLDFLK